MRVDYTPTGAATVAATTTQTLNVAWVRRDGSGSGAGGGSGSNNALSIIFGNGGQGGRLQASHA